ncbi:SpoIID/LytB domain-containing protein [Demequina flava]|uniref:SpoIID/LytB domain-containing protein n=1 Tax=Demequina flava TaxID=1095025 RepID=UPI000784937F|nr:SpoIID/LytB domain-containing protein [Demequina flava]
MLESTRRTPWRALIVALVAALLIPLMAAPQAQSASRFSDVPSSNQFSTHISWLAASGITTGYLDGTFRPKESISREAMAAFLYRMAGRPSVTLPSRSPFKDVSTKDQFYKEIVWLSKAGITTGYSDGTFRPKDDISREAMAAFIYRYEDRPSYSAPSRSPFKDVSTSAQFYKEITWLRSSGITTGYSDGTYQPKGDVTREAMAAFLYRLAKQSSGGSSGGGTTTPAPTIPSSFTVSGAGWGHGVGMSQYGALGMAEDGSNETQILEHYYSGTDVTTVNADEDIRVEVFGSYDDWWSSATVVVRSLGPDSTDDGQWVMRFYSDSGLTEKWTGKNNEKLHITRSGNSVTVERDDGEKATATKDISLQWEATSYYQSGSNEDVYVDIYKGNGASEIRATHGKYRHGKLLISAPEGRLIIANELKLNTEYLYGIAEMPSSWHGEALQAQAITARGYAMRAVDSGISRGCNCHLYDDTRSQNFTGWNKENEGTDAYYGKRWVAAVDATNSSGGANGEVVTYGGKIATTYYFSSSGGQTERSDDIWVSQPGYLKSVDDKWSLGEDNVNRAWTYSLSQSRAKSIFGLSDVVSIKVTSRTSGGSDAAAEKITATSSTGKTSSISGPDSIRSKLVGGKSPWIWSIKANY